MESSLSAFTSAPEGQPGAAQESTPDTSTSHSAMSQMDSKNTTNKRKRSPTTDTKNDMNNNNMTKTQTSAHNDGDEEDPSSEPPKKARSNNTRGKASAAPNVKDVKKLEAEIRAAKKKAEDYRKQLARVTTESILNARRGSKEIWDLTKITTEFKGLSRDIKDWIKKYGITRPLSSLSKDIKVDFLSGCTGVAALYFSVFAENDFPVIETLPKGAYLLLEGFIFAWASAHLIQRRFAFLDEALKDHDAKPKRELVRIGNYEEKFESFATELEKVSPYQSQKWISSMLQAVKPIMIPEFSSTGTKSQLEKEKRTENFLRKYETDLASLVNEFLKSPAKHILSLPHDPGRRKDQREELKGIFRRFRELAYHMWCQPSSVSCEYRMNAAQFDPDTMELDFRALFRRPDDEPERLRGDRVLININPAIVGVTIDPDNDGRRQTTYLKRKVWTENCQAFNRSQNGAGDADGQIPEPRVQKGDPSNDGQGGSTVAEFKDNRDTQPEAMDCRDDGIVAPEEGRQESTSADKQIVNPAAGYHAAAQNQTAELALRVQQNTSNPTQRRRFEEVLDVSPYPRQEGYAPANNSSNDHAAQHQVPKTALHSEQNSSSPPISGRQNFMSLVNRLLAAMQDAVQDDDAPATYNSVDRAAANTILRTAPDDDAAGNHRHNNHFDGVVVPHPVAHLEIDDTSTEDESDDAIVLYPTTRLVDSKSEIDETESEGEPEAESDEDYQPE